MAGAYSVIISARKGGFTYKVCRVRAPATYATWLEAAQAAWDDVQTAIDCPEEDLRTIVTGVMDTI